jgi:hypothetical protein
MLANERRAIVAELAVHEGGEPFGLDVLGRWKR